MPLITRSNSRNNYEGKLINYYKLSLTGIVDNSKETEIHNVGNIFFN